MRVFVPNEVSQRERRTAATPETVAKLRTSGAEVLCEPGLGSGAYHPDEAYTQAGAAWVSREEGLTTADLVLRIHKPSPREVSLLKPGCVHISFLDPFRDPESIRMLATRGVTALSLELIPRTTLAQRMDALSSQASLGGYVAVLLAANRLPKVFPMMMTPAGTLAPALVFVIGAGVAGLQAIATARRLGARVEAFDTRPVVEEQVKSLGARFVKVDLGTTEQTKDGYAKELTPEQLQRQREAMARHCAQADIVITTAQVFGRPAPRIVTREMIRNMRPGSVIVDMAVETGGNVEGSRLDEEVLLDGVCVMGYGNLPSRVPTHASQMLANNLLNLFLHGWSVEEKKFMLHFEDEIFRGCVVTHEGRIVHELISRQLG